MKLGLFMMPLHDPKRDYTKVLEEDRQAILLAEKLGYQEAWVGEHYSATTEPITDPLQFMATLVPITKSINFGTSVLNLPQHHPAQVAGNCAMFDHLCKGRFIMGIGPGGLGSDFELFKVTDKDRSEMMVELIEIIHKIWAADPPYRIPGKYWDITIENSYQPRLGRRNSPREGPLQFPARAVGRVFAHNQAFEHSPFQGRQLDRQHRASGRILIDKSDITRPSITPATWSAPDCQDCWVGCSA